MITLSSNITNAQYLELVDYAFGRCDCFALNIPLFNAGKSDDNNEGTNDFINQLRPYIISRFVSKNYLSIRSSYKREIYVIDTSEAACKIVKSVGDLYRWIHPYYPEDISFLTSSSGKCWLETVAHEDECRIYRPTDADIGFLNECRISYMRDDDDDYVPCMRKSAEHIPDRFSGILYDIGSDWQKTDAGYNKESGTKGVIYRNSVLSDDVSDLYIEIREMNLSGTGSAAEYIKNSIETLDCAPGVFKIIQKEIIVDGLSATEYVYREDKEGYHKNVTHIDIFCRINATTAVIFSYAGSGQINERRFRFFMDSVEFTY